MNSERLIIQKKRWNAFKMSREASNRRAWRIAGPTAVWGGLGL